MEKQYPNRKNFIEITTNQILKVMTDYSQAAALEVSASLVLQRRDIIKRLIQKLERTSSRVGQWERTLSRVHQWEADLSTGQDLFSLNQRAFELIEDLREELLDLKLKEVVELEEEQRKRKTNIEQQGPTTQ